MKVLNKSQIINAEAEFMRLNNLNTVSLIESAANAFILQFIQNVDNTNYTILILCGNGKNGADGLQIANGLVKMGFNVEVGIILISAESSPEFTFYSHNIYHSIPKFTLELQDLSAFILPYHDILIDGIFGIGLNRSLSADFSNFIEKINSYDSYKIAIDIPSGLYCDGAESDDVIICDETIAIACYKPAHFLNEKTDYIGKLKLAKINLLSSFINNIQSELSYLDDNIVKNLLVKSNRLTHKYQLGNSLLIGGGHGMSGCMKLSGEAALRAGCGLVTLHVPYSAVDFLQASFPEAIIHIDDNKYHIGPFDLPEKINAIGIGMGMGVKIKQEELILNLFDQVTHTPVVIDADALTLLSSINEWKNKLPKNCIFTPHKGEFERLFGIFKSQNERIDFMKNFSREYNHVIILKGADTMISLTDGSVYFSNIGDCGMATAGSGDVLTGILTSLLAQGYHQDDAARIGVYLHGAAGSLSAKKKGSKSMIASDIISNIGNAYHFLENHNHG